jgi:hypothetical protein
MAQRGTRTVRIALAAAALAGGCAAPHPPPPRSGSASALVLRASTQCGAEDEGATARWIPTEGALHAALIATGGLASEGAMPKIDFGREGVVLVSMGQRRTGGYALTLADPKVNIANGIATMVVAFEEPPPGAMVTQALTSPCLLVRVPKSGIRELRVVDTSGTVRAAVAVPYHADRRQAPPERRPGGAAERR